MSKALSRYHARKAWERHHNACILPGMQLHHKDGDAFNNDISNLVVCTPEEHKEYHRQLGHKIQGNFIARADFFSKMSPDAQLEFRRRASEYARRQTFRKRTEAEKAKLKLANVVRSNTIEMVELKTGKIVAEFSSVRDAEVKLKIQRAHIRRVISGKRKAWRGHVFRYKEFKNPG